MRVLDVEDFRCEERARAMHTLSFVQDHDRLSDEALEYLRASILVPTKFTPAFRAALTEGDLLGMFKFDTNHFRPSELTEVQVAALYAWWGPTRTLTLLRKGNIRWDKELFLGLSALICSHLDTLDVKTVVLWRQRVLVLGNDSWLNALNKPRAEEPQNKALDWLTILFGESRLASWTQSIQAHRYNPKLRYDNTEHAAVGLTLVPDERVRRYKPDDLLYDFNT